MAEILKFTDYYIDGVNWFIRTIQQEIALRDIVGITNGRVQAINVTGHHPLVQLLGNLIDPVNQVSFAGLLPCVSVSENTENEEVTTIGQGKRVVGVVDISFVNDMRANYADMLKRNREGIITNSQLTTLENALTGDKKLITEVEEFGLRESVFVSLWCNTLEEQLVLGNVMRSIIFDVRKKMIAEGVIDINITTSRGLVNFNFGKIVYGQETEISFLNFFRNYTVTDEEAKDIDEYDVIIVGKYKNTVDTNYVRIYDI